MVMGGVGVKVGGGGAQSYTRIKEYNTYMYCNLYNKALYNHWYYSLMWVHIIIVDHHVV